MPKEKYAWVVAAIRREDQRYTQPVAYLFDNKAAAEECFDRLSISRGTMGLNAPERKPIRSQF
jgi:hypothetical protein